MLPWVLGLGLLGILGYLIYRNRKATHPSVGPSPGPGPTPGPPPTSYRFACTNNVCQETSDPNAYHTLQACEANCGQWWKCETVGTGARTGQCVPSKTPTDMTTKAQCQQIGQCAAPQYFRCSNKECVPNLDPSGCGPTHPPNLTAYHQCTANCAKGTGKC